jgi:SAM-dependent methyltransferase
VPMLRRAGVIGTVEDAATGRTDPRAHAARPLYGTFASAYNAVAPDNAQAQAAAASTQLAADEGPILDAGCGTGRLLAHLGKTRASVIGIDLSSALLRQARVHDPTSLLAEGDLAALPFSSESFAGVLCRGVLNDVLHDRQRDVILRELARVLCPNGRLLLDVRDWQRTFDRYGEGLHVRRMLTTDDGRTVRFETHTEADPEAQRLLIHETVEVGGSALTSEFVMRCWTKEELEHRLVRAELNVVTIDFGDGSTWPEDRLVVLAQAPASSDGARR